MIEQELASIAKYCSNVAEIEDIYFDEIPEGFERPSIYFPTVEQIPRGDTLSTYAYMNSWFIKVFDETTTKAFETASKIVNSIWRKRRLIPLMKEDGTPEGKGVRLREIRLNRLDTGTIQIQLDWDSVFFYEVDSSHEKARNFYFNMSLKGGE